MHDILESTGQREWQQFAHSAIIRQLHRLCFTRYEQTKLKITICELSAIACQFPDFQIQTITKLVSRKRTMFGLSIFSDWDYIEPGGI